MRYWERRDHKREISMECSPNLFQPSFAEESDNKVMLQSYINKLECEARFPELHWFKGKSGIK
ncbi:hypothetical protein C1T20_14250 [Paenibacillus polymyxa]|nr:hypothetical protein C1T20_14250 [Paenibacillus polymyxa]